MYLAYSNILVWDRVPSGFWICALPDSQPGAGAYEIRATQLVPLHQPMLISQNAVERCRFRQLQRCTAWWRTDLSVGALLSRQAVMSGCQLQSHIVQVLDCMDQMDAAKPDWGITYFHYDWFSATRRAVARDVRYDTFITVYMSDCDYYPRVRQAGFETPDAANVCSTVPSVYDMKGHMDLPLDDYTKTKEALDGTPHPSSLLERGIPGQEYS